MELVLFASGLGFGASVVMLVVDSAYRRVSPEPFFILVASILAMFYYLFALIV